VSLFTVGIATFSSLLDEKNACGRRRILPRAYGDWRLTSLTESPQRLGAEYSLFRPSRHLPWSGSRRTFYPRDQVGSRAGVAPIDARAFLLAGGRTGHELLRSTPFIFQLDRLTALMTSDGYAYWFHYHLLTLCTAAVAGRLFYTAILRNADDLTGALSRHEHGQRRSH
jgi:hypothetical protein